MVFSFTLLVQHACFWFFSIIQQDNYHMVCYVITEVLEMVILKKPVNQFRLRECMIAEILLTRTEVLCIY